MSKRFIIAICLLLFPVTAFSQNSFHKLSPGKSILGLNLSFLEDGRAVGGELQYAIDESTAANFGAGIGFFDEQHGLTFPPSPAAGIAIGKIGPLGQTPLGYFSYISFGVTSVRTIDRRNNVVVATALSLGPSGNVGVFKPLEISPGLMAIPFFGLFYTHLWTTAGADYSDLNLNDTVNMGEFSGTLGIEFELSPKFGVFGVLDFSFDDSERTSRIGVNFY